MTAGDDTRPSPVWTVFGLALMAGLIWFTNTDSPAFAFFRIALAWALLLGATPFTYAVTPQGPAPWDGWSGQRNLDFAVAMGSWFAAFMLIASAEETMRNVTGWLVGAVVGGAVFGGLSAWLARDVWAPFTIRAELDTARPRMATPGARLWHLMRPGLVFFALPPLVFMGPVQPLDIWLFTFVATVLVARMPPAFPRTGEDASGWRLRPHGVAGWFALGLFVLAFLLLVLRAIAPPFF